MSDEGSDARVGRRLDALASDGLRLVHDRRVPGPRAGLDYLAVAPAGAVLVDVKNHRGRVRVQSEGGRGAQRSRRLMVGRREGDHMVDQMHDQMRRVRDCLAAAGGSAVPVIGVFCLVDAEWPLIRRPLLFERIHVVWPAKIEDCAVEPRSLDEGAIDRWHEVLVDGFVAV